MTAMRYVSFRFFASYTPFQRTSLSTKLASASTRIWRLLPLDKACPYSLARKPISSSVLWRKYERSNKRKCIQNEFYGFMGCILF